MLIEKFKWIPGFKQFIMINVKPMPKMAKVDHTLWRQTFAIFYHRIDSLWIQKCLQNLYIAQSHLIIKLLYNCVINSSPPGENGRHFAGDIFRCIFVNETFCILIKISLKFVPKDPNDNTTALIWKMAWGQIVNKPLPEPTLTQIPDAILHH